MWCVDIKKRNEKRGGENIFHIQYSREHFLYDINTDYLLFNFSDNMIYTVKNTHGRL